MTTATHIAGPIMMLNGRIIQRCPVCGEKLIDVQKEGASTFQAWPSGVWVRIANGQQVRIKLADDNVKGCPDDFCLSLVER